MELPDDGAGDELYLEMIGQLSSELEKANAELERVTAKRTVDDVRAQMLEEYSNKVFYFVAAYCFSVGAMLVMAGFTEKTGFKLSDTILSIIAGSTAVSVIGLIGMVVSGLFGGAARATKVRSK
jgi:hypothetical protein